MKLWKILLILTLGLTIYLVIAKITSPQILPITKINERNLLEETVTKSLEGSTGTYAIVVKNLKTGESYANFEHRQFKAGSLYKLWVMAAVFQQLQQGILKEDDDLNGDIAALNQEFGIDPNDAELSYGTIDFTVGSALTQMITISHNYAALLLVDKITLQTVDDFIKKNDFQDSKVGLDSDSPITSAYDIAMLYERLYNGEFADIDNTNKMLELLKKQQLNSKLPKYLPQGTIVAHKTGEIDYLTHDAGIVYTPKGDYIIVIMSESDLPAGAEERIAGVSKAVFDYFENK